jgi:hypothetical protein
MMIFLSLCLSSPKLSSFSGVLLYSAQLAQARILDPDGVRGHEYAEFYNASSSKAYCCSCSARSLPAFTTRHLTRCVAE